MTAPLKIIALSGSLRQDSYNTAALRAAVEDDPRMTGVPSTKGAL